MSLTRARVVERGDELGELLLRDPAQLADLETAQLAGPEQVIDLVAAHVQHLRYLLDGVCLQLYLTSFHLSDGLSSRSTRWLATPCGCLMGEQAQCQRLKA